MTAILFVGFCVAVSFLIASAFSLRCKTITGFLMLGILLRVLMMLADYYGLFGVPGSDADAAAFTRHAKSLSDLPWSEMRSYYNPTHAFNGYAFYGALAMRFVGYHELVMPALNLVAGSLVLGVSGITVYNMWGSRAARISTFILAVYPFAIFNSAIALREEFAIAAFVIGLYFILRWVKTDSWLIMLLSIVFLTIAISIHPGFVGAFLGLFAYMVICVWRSIKLIAQGQSISRKIASSSLIGAVAVTVLVGMITVGGGFSLGKGIIIGGEVDTDIAELIESRFQRDSRGGSGYPDFITYGNPFSQPWLIPARIVYFHFSPFIWDIRSARHVLGLVSSILYLFLAFRIYKGWNALKGREESLLLFLMLGGLTFVFAIGVTNIGTAIRHKTKLLTLILLLAASSFNRLNTKMKLWK